MLAAVDVGKRGERPACAHREGHAHFRVHARGRAGGGSCCRGRRCLSMRAAADARHRVSDARAAAVGGHRGQRIAQSVRRQRHQVLLGGGHQTARRGRGGDRDNDGEADGVRPSAELGKAGASKTPRGATSNSARARFHRSSTCAACVWWSTARTARTITSRRRVFHELGAEVVADRRRAERHEHQRRLRRDASEGARREVGEAQAPTSASRSTATAIGW